MIGISTILQGECGESSRHGPTLRFLHKVLNCLGADRAVQRTPEKLGGLGFIKLQILHPDFCDQTLSTHPGQGDGRIEARDDCQVQASGGMPQELFQELVDLRVADAVVVVQHEDEPPVRDIQVIADQAGQSLGRGQVLRREQRLDIPKDPC